MNTEQMAEFENHLRTAGKALRCAWRLAKHHGMEKSAKEMADTVLDVETAAEQALAHYDEMRRADQVTGGKE